MIFLSHLIDSPRIKNPWTHELRRDYPQVDADVVRPIDVDALDGIMALGVYPRVALRVDQPTPELLADVRYPRVSIWPCPLSEYRGALRQCYWRWLDEITVDCLWDGHAVRLPASRSYHRWLVDLVMEVDAGDVCEDMNYSIPTCGGSVSVEQHQMCEVYSYYREALRAYPGGDLIALGARIECAQYVADLDRIRIGEPTRGG